MSGGIEPFDWHRMLLGNEPPLFLLEIAFRVVAIYLFAVLFMRLVGKRGNRSMSPFQTVLIIALGSAAGDSMFYPDVPLLYAFLVIGTVICLDLMLTWAQARWQALNALLEGSPTLLVKDGKIIESGLRQADLERDELMGMLREQEIENTRVVKRAFLERSGNLGIYRFEDGSESEGSSTAPPDLEGE